MALKEKDKSLISYTNPGSIISEQYRTIRTNINFSSIEKQYRTLLIASPGYGEGKTTTVTNLGISMAQQGGKVLIVDADLRKPSLHTIFSKDNQAGLASILSTNSSLEEAITSTEIEGLEILAGGQIPSNPAELLASREMEQLIHTAIQCYDIVLFDSPPILDVTDGRILANRCEATILVFGNGKTKAEDALEAKRLLELARANCIGVILNKK
ncbi:CpsD/CapB family tyrosine-protein kinase [Bacillus dakarensis]|uniref:CpsD/CapB family tyrosine-protein kinase n=1 Tax=Robertmurraya dakarensis TaxID=1926278 RepID=UPI00098107D0|nr:CpsD/CapB family tyrosine-protein kinase [Bacillus dakarensis]